MSKTIGLATLAVVLSFSVLTSAARADMMMHKHMTMHEKMMMKKKMMMMHHKKMMMHHDM